MEPRLEKLVWQRAGSRCEYCHLPAELSTTPHQIDHIIAQKHGGKTTPENLALACFFCNSYKGPNIAGIDPLDESIVRLFHPRKDDWKDHFSWNGPVLVGFTSVGRVTLRVLEINEPESIAFRLWLIAADLLSC